MRKQNVRGLNRKYGWLFAMLLFYLGLKMVINSEPIFSVLNGRVNFGLFNFYEKPPAVVPEYQFAINPIMEISPYSTDLEGEHPQPPLKARDANGNFHLMGTDRLGRDVFAGFASGFELAIIISLSVGLLTGLITILFGAAGAYYNRFPKKTTKLVAAILIICFLKFMLLLTWYLIGIYSGLTFILFTLLILIVAIIIIKLPVKESKSAVSIPLDSMNRRFLEFFQPIPDLIFLMLFALLFDQMNIFGLITILILLRIPFGSYYLQGLADQFINQQHIDQAKSMGVSSFRIIFRHLIPMMIPGATIFMVLSASRAVLSESALAFLGIGPTGNYITWGTMIKLGLSNLSMWWVSFFPILGMVGLSLMYQRLGKN